MPRGISSSDRRPAPSAPGPAAAGATARSGAARARRGVAARAAGPGGEGGGPTGRGAGGEERKKGSAGAGGPGGSEDSSSGGLFPEGYGAKEFFADVKLQFTANLPAMDDLVENRDPAAAERRRRRAYGDKDLDEEMAFASLLASPGFAKGGAAAVGAFLFLYVFIIGPPPS